MNVTFTILTVLILIASVLLVAVVLLQNGKGGGLASNFVAGNQTLGVRQTADLLEKVTWGLVAFILVLSIAASFTFSASRSNGAVDITTEIEQGVPAAGQPAFPVSPIEAAEDPTAE